MTNLHKKQRGKTHLKALCLIIFAIVMFSIPLISATYQREFFSGGKACAVAIPASPASPQIMTFTIGGDGLDGDFTLDRTSWYLNVAGAGTLNYTIWTTTGVVPDAVPDLPLGSVQVVVGGASEAWFNASWIGEGIELINGTQYGIGLDGNTGGTVCRDVTGNYKHGKRFNYKSADTDEYNFRIYGNVSAVGSGEVELISPVNDSVFSIPTINFTANYTASKFSMKNATYSVWYNNGTLFNRTTLEINPISNSTNLSVYDFTLNNYKWNVEMCSTNDTATYCVSNSENNTFAVGASLTSSSYLTNVFETSYQTFTGIFNMLPGAEVALAQLIYNGTTHTISDVTQDGTTLTISKSINVPLNYNTTSNQTNNFNFRFTYAGSSVQNSEVLYQNSSFIDLRICGNPFNITSLNFTLRDENTLINIDPEVNYVTWESTFKYWLGNGDVFKNYSYQLLNSTTQNNFTFCIYPYLPNNYTFKTDSDIEFMAKDYSENEYHLRDATLTNATSDFSLLLFLIDSDLSTKFYITVNRGISAVTDALVNIAKYFVGEGGFKTTSIKITDADGKFPMYADLDAKYLFSVVKDGQVLGIVEKTLTCATAPCEATIELSDIFGDGFGGFGEVYAGNIYSNLTFNTTSRVVTYVFFDISGLANYFRLHVTEMSFNNTIGKTICNEFSYSSAGTLSCNLTGYDGDFIAKTYISRSPEKLDKVLNFIISDALDKLGLLGIFLNLAIIITVILATATTTRGSPSAIVFMLGLTILLLKIGGIFPFSWGIVAPIELIIVWIIMKSKG